MMAWRGMLAAFAAVLASRVAQAESSRCPSPEAVERELQPLLGAAASELETSTATTIEDEGATYRLRVGQAERRISDPARDCAERAKVSAVFIALNLPKRSPRPAPPPPPRPAPPPALPPAAAVEPAAPSGLLLRALAAVDHAPQAERVAMGLGLGATVWHGKLGLTLSLGAQPRMALPAEGGGSYELWRMPSSLSVGYGDYRSTLGVGIEAGFALDLLRFRGLSVPNPDVGVRLNAGLRAAMLLKLRAGRDLSAILMPGLAYYPRTYLVRLEPTRLLGESPQLWWGVGIGLESSFLGG